MMRPYGEGLKVYLYRDPVDMRMWRNGLAAVAQGDKPQRNGAHASVCTRLPYSQSLGWLAVLRPALKLPSPATIGCVPAPIPMALASPITGPELLTATRNRWSASRAAAIETFIITATTTDPPEARGPIPRKRAVQMRLSLEAPIVRPPRRQLSGD